MTEARFPPTPTCHLPNEYKSYGKDLDDIIGKAFGENGKLMTYKDDKDALLGPFPILIASKQIGTQYMALNKSFGALEGLPPDAREVAILTIGARYQAAFELYAHSSLAVNSNLLTQTQVDLISSGKKPEDLNEKCSVTYDAVQHLANVPGPLSKELFDRCVQAFGKEGTVLLAHYAGTYAYTCILLNVADASVPKD
ncbi:uncharacterized protein RCC_04701 [Ramularia collo-cygni]|uniref:Carboxymuconolactone decarboxylase-like domain-containing protein n=1 Tax=Ramularia collo-cygni TaxID=112498 RepID=A0A2D3V5P3_9PEZI|nr:uncharacterized protein RCC_04701 [Ramularia collo-cygni]CZT18856.1 uncharacterized protein RCC_04701 [Ramularia collo-cygni]